LEQHEGEKFILGVNYLFWGDVSLVFRWSAKHTVLPQTQTNG